MPLQYMENQGRGDVIWQVSDESERALAGDFRQVRLERIAGMNGDVGFVCKLFLQACHQVTVYFYQV